MFKSITNIQSLHEKIEQFPLTFIYITQPNCSVCHGLQPQLEGILNDFPEIKSFVVNADQVPKVAGDFQVFTAPTLLLFVDGKEFIREARFVQTERLYNRISHIYNEMAGHY